MLVSNRNIPLVTQTHEKRMLTVENYCKWYDLFLVETDGTVTAVSPEVIDINTWIDHYVVPEYFEELAVQLGAAYDEDTWKTICGLYERWCMRLQVCVM